MKHECNPLREYESLQSSRHQRTSVHIQLSAHHSGSIEYQAAGTSEASTLARCVSQTLAFTALYIHLHSMKVARSFWNLSCKIMFVGAFLTLVHTRQCHEAALALDAIEPNAGSSFGMSIPFLRCDRTCCIARRL